MFANRTLSAMMCLQEIDCLGDSLKSQSLSFNAADYSRGGIHNKSRELLLDCTAVSLIQIWFSRRWILALE